MSVTTVSHHDYGHGESARGFFGRILDRIVAARLSQAERYVNGYLLSLDDKTLESLGYDRKALQARPSNDRFYF